MANFILNLVSRSILNKQNSNKISFFKSVNKNKKQLKIFDIGGAGGIQTRWKLYEKLVDVTFFEPDKRSSNQLKKQGIKVIEKAFWSKKINKKLFLTRKFHISSFFKPNRKFLDQFSDSQRYDIVGTKEMDLSKMDDHINVKNQPHFIKLDVQGAELEILKGSKNTLKNVLAIEIELNFKEIYEKMPLSFAIDNFLTKHDFIFNDYLTFFRWEKLPHKAFDEVLRMGELVHSDALYIKSQEDIFNLANNSKSRMDIFENYIKILFSYNKLDLIKTFSKKITKKENKLLNLDKIILYLEKKQKKLIRLNKLFLYFTRYFVCKNILSHWKL